MARMEVCEKLGIAKESIRNTRDVKQMFDILKTRIPVLLRQVNDSLRKKLWDNDFELNWFIGDLENLKTATKTKLDKYYKEVDKDQLDEFHKRLSEGELDYIILNDLKNKRVLIETIIQGLSKLYVELCNYTYLLELIKLEGSKPKDESK